MADRFWDAGTGIDGIDDVISEHAEAAVRHVLTKGGMDGGVEGYFPMEYFPSDGGSGDVAPPADALTFRVYLEGVEAKRDFSLTAELDSAFENIEDGSYLEGVTKVVEALEAAAAKGRAAINAYH